MDETLSERKNLLERPVSSAARKSSFGTVMTLVIIVAIIVIGAFYAWGQRVAEDRQLPPTQLPE